MESTRIATVTDSALRNVFVAANEGREGSNLEASAKAGRPADAHEDEKPIGPRRRQC